MSSKQGVTKDQDSLDRERDEVRRRTEQAQVVAEEKKKSLEELREKSRGKLEAVIKTKAPKKASGLSQYQLALLVVGGVVALLVILPFIGNDNQSSSDLIIDAEWIEKWNKEANRPFKLGANEFFEGWTLSDASSHFSSITNNGRFDTCSELQIENLPKKFSTRQKHVSCLSPIYDQSKCASSYAFAISGMATNRYCIANDGNKKFDASAQYILSCESKAQCRGGDIGASATAALNKGLVNTFCIPYNPERVDTCDKQKTSACYRLHFNKVCSTSDVEQIKRHVFKNGPVASLVTATKEFLVYSGGVYDYRKCKL